MQNIKLNVDVKTDTGRKNLNKLENNIDSVIKKLVEANKEITKTHVQSAKTRIDSDKPGGFQPGSFSSSGNSLELQNLDNMVQIRKEKDLEYIEWRKELWIQEHQFEYALFQRSMASVEKMYSKAIDLMIDKDMSWKKANQLVKDSLKDLAKSLLKAVVKTLMQAAVQSIASGIIIERAMKKPAILTSLATGGTNSLGAVAGIKATQRAMMFSQGGYVSGVGSSVSDSIPAFLSHGEYVVNAQATRSNKELLNDLNSGSSGSISAGLEKVASLLKTINMNLVRKNLSVNVVNDHVDSETAVINHDITRNKMIRGGYNA